MEALQSNIRGFTDLIKKVIEVGKTDVKDVPGKVKEKLRSASEIQSNKKLMENTLSDGKAATDEFLGDMGDEVKAYVEATRTREEAENQRNGTINEIVKRFKQTDDPEEQKQLREDARALLPETRVDFVDEIDRLENEVVKVATAANSKKAKPEEKAVAVAKVQQDVDRELEELVLQTPLGQAMNELRESLLTASPERIEESRDMITIESGVADYRELPQEHLDTYEQAYADFASLTEWVPSTIVGSGAVDGIPRAQAGIRYSEDFDEKATYRGEDREQRVLERKGKMNRARVNYGYGDTNLTEAYRTEVLYHEFGHVLMGDNPDLEDMNQRWLESRATGKAQKLSEITGNESYGDNEIALPGPFFTPYVARQYEPPDSLHPRNEVFSTGIEHFGSIKKMIDFYSKDPEHFALIVGTLKELKRRAK